MFASVVQDKVLKRIEDAAGRAVRPVFGETARARDRVGMVTSYAAGPSPAAAPRGATPLALYHELEAASTSEALEVAKKLRQQVKDVVAAANPVPVAMPAIGPPGAESTSETPPTPDFRVLQGYRGPGPAGFGFDLAWHLPGGTGEGVIVVNLEGGWRITHEALSAVNFGLLSGVNREESGWRQHGTAVAGMLSSQTEQVEGGGIFGLCAGARVCPLSLYVEPDRPRDRLAQQIVASLQILRPGGVLLVELQRPGPATDFEANTDQKGYIPVSYWGDVRAALQRVVAAGVTVVEVGGNGGQNLDDAGLYQGTFNQSQNDSGGIMVGAGAAPNGRFGAAVAAVVLQLRLPPGLPGLGAVGGDLRLRRPLGRPGLRPELYLSVHGHVERRPDHRRARRLPAGAAPARLRVAAEPRRDPPGGGHHRLGPGRRAGRARAHRAATGPGHAVPEVRPGLSRSSKRFLHPRVRKPGFAGH